MKAAYPTVVLPALRAAAVFLGVGLLPGFALPARAQDPPANPDGAAPATPAPRPTITLVEEPSLPEPADEVTGTQPVPDRPAPAQDAPANQLPPPKVLPAEKPHFPEPESKSRISDEVIGIQPVPDRPPLLVEKNGDFLGPGFLSQGIQTHTGEIVRPSFWVFGTNRLALQYFNNQTTTNTAELVDRLDLFGQLNLTGTERFLVGFRPLDHEVHNVRRYTSYDFSDGRYVDGWNLYPQTLFFEGDFGEIFPGLDPYDTKALDYGFSIGRQPVFIQEGMFINADMLDAVTVTRNTLHGHGILNSRITAMYAWDQVHRNDDISFYLEDPKAHLFGLFTETDLKVSTVNVDLAYVLSSDQGAKDGIYFATSATQRLELSPWHTINSTFRIMGSFPTEGETLQTGKGVLLFSELSVTPHGTDDLVYCTTFGAIGRCTSPARGVETGGPLSPQAGILFARPQIGVFGAPLNTLADDVVGGALGYQILMDCKRKQWTFEIGGRQSTDGSHSAAIGLGVLYQQAIGQHCILLMNVAVSKEESLDPAVGARIEWLTKF
jgi:hypothetical protein